MKKILRALVISACATAAASVALKIASQRGESPRQPQPKLSAQEQEFADLDKEQTDALLTELAAQT